ncbi:hypothetical protein DVH24_021527 [Malus domestica]|uniref:Uncharacterized protein n=1 Tax=Malus domestica TaxID=3750 RepID=A0A498JX16_MALDO|nr:hypothetical protein DVH24_021527 [Malus domestica]
MFCKGKQFKAMDRNCVGKAIKYFYQVKKKQADETQRVGKVLTTKTTDWFLVIVVHVYLLLVNNPIVNTAIIRGQLKEQLKAPKIVKGQGEPFCTSWLTHERLLLAIDMLHRLHNVW